MTKNEDPEYLSIREAAALCRVGEKTLRRWIAAGYLPAYRMGPALLRVNRAELLERIRGRQVPSVHHARRAG